MKPLKMIIAALVAIGLAAANAYGVDYTMFGENQADANGFFQWNNPNNWNTGNVPDINYACRVGSTYDTAISARIETGPAAVVYQMRVDKSVDGPSTLTVKNNSLTTTYRMMVNYGNTIGTSQMIVENSNITSGNYLGIGSYGVGNPGAFEMTGGTLEANMQLYVGTQGATARGEGSSVILNGVDATVAGVIDVGSSNANDPGLLKLTGTGSFTATGGDTDIYVAAFEIDGGNQTINLASFLLQSGSDSVLKLSGSGLSTIYATSATFSNSSILNVDDLSVADNTYKVIDATGSITDNGLAFAAGTDPNAWSFTVDDTNNDLLLTYDSGAPQPVYTLTVNSGDGDGNYEASTIVDITADAPPDGNQVFDVWTGDTANIADTSEPNTAISMPAADTEITATYVEKTAYLLTVNSGSGDGNYYSNEVIDITADAPPDANYIFDVWTGDTANIADTSEPNTTITMLAANAEVTATYTLIGVYTLSVNSGSGDGDYEASTIVDILADDPPVGDIFDVWTGDTANIDDTSEANTTITMPAANTEITATYADDPNTFSLTVNSGSGDGIYDPDAVVDITANAPGSGQTFDVWTGDTAYVTDVSEPNTTVTMPAANVTVTATYTSTAGNYRLLVVAGSGDGYYDPNTVVDIFADQPSQGQTFSVWVGDTAYIANVNQANTNVTMPSSDVTVTAVYSGTPPTWSGFEMNEADGNGDYLWLYPNNWDNGLPGSAVGVEIGNDQSGQAIHCVLYEPGATCLHFELAEHANTQGSSLKVRQGATLTMGGTVVIAKDREGWLYIDGTVSHLVSNKTFRVGGYWGRPDLDLPCAGNVLISSTGVLEAWFVAINTRHPTSDAPSNPWGPDYWATATDSEIVVDGGVLVSQQGLRMSTTDANRPGLLKLQSDASFTSNADGTYGIEMWCGTWQIDGDDANIHVGDIELWGNKFANEVNGYNGQPVGSGVSILKFSGDGVSTIHATSVDFIDAAYLDVADLNVPNGTYKLIDANSVTDANDCLAFVDGTDMNVWSFSTDDTNGDLLLTYDSGIYHLDVWNGTGDGDYAADTVVDILADDPQVGQLFDVWTDDTAGVDDVYEPNTTYTMPAMDAEVVATYKDDTNTFILTVNYGDGDGAHLPNTVVDITAKPPLGNVFDIWTGDTDNIADTSEPNTTISMPSADTEITADWKADPNYGAPSRGYSARACGFDMNRNGVIGEPADATVGDGSTTDPDGDSTDEDLIYVDATDGNDTTGDGSPSNPYKTVQYALDQADGPGDGAEDIVCIAGVFNEELTLTQSGVTGYYTRDNFQFPDNPFMLIGWDTDADGEYPPYDADDTAVLDGNVGPNLQLAINNQTNQKSYLEIAHLSIDYYGRDSVGDKATQGAMRVAGSDSSVSHIYFHDVEMKSINDGVITDGYMAVWSMWGGTPRYYLAFVNNLLDGTSNYCFRGAPTGSNWRVQNLTMNYTFGYYKSGGTLNLGTGWKVWGEHSEVEFLNNIYNGLAPLPGTIGGTGIGVRPCVRNYTIRNCEFYDLRTAIGVDGLSSGGCHARRNDDIFIDRNYIRTTSTDFPTTSYGGPQGIHIKDGGLLNETTEDVTITNNFFSSTRENARAIRSDASNTEGDQPGVITIAGNTMYGPGSGSDYCGLFIGYGTNPYKQNDYVIKNNIIANTGSNNKNVRVINEPNRWVANGNIYDPVGLYVWDSSEITTFADWQTATGQDANSKTDTPIFVDASNGDLHLDPSDNTAEGAGVDITSITTVDFDGDARSATTPWAGADVGVEANVPPNNPPVAVDDAYSVDEDITLNVSEANGVLANDSDPNDDPLTAELVTDVSNGTLTLYSNGSFDYTPNGDWNGVDSFIYKAYDGQDYSNDANAVITVNAVNDPPTADDDAYSVDQDITLNVSEANGVLDNDTDVENDPLTAILVTDVSNGTLTLYSTGAFDYTPDANYVGEDMFVYKANDGELDSGDANVVITVSSTAPTDDYASAESTTRGTVDGNYTDTYSSDDSYEALTEVVQANRSKLEHEWTFSVTGGTSVQFSVEAYKAGTEDDFKFEYSPNGSDWTYMLTVSKTSDDNTPQTFDLPGGTSGTFYIHVLDTNRDNKAKDLDTVYVDHMFIRSE